MKVLEIKKYALRSATFFIAMVGIISMSLAQESENGAKFVYFGKNEIQSGYLKSVAKTTDYHETPVVAGGRIEIVIDPLEEVVCGYWTKNCLMDNLRVFYRVRGSDQFKSVLWMDLEYKLLPVIDGSPSHQYFRVILISVPNDSDRIEVFASFDKYSVIYQGFDSIGQPTYTRGNNLGKHWISNYGANFSISVLSSYEN